MTDPLAPYRPTPADPFDLAKVGHLLRRGGFSASLSLRRRLVRQGVDAAMTWLNRAGNLADNHDVVVSFNDIERVRAYRVWLALHGEDPLRQRLSYFWHDHFATSNQKIKDPRAMARQMQTFDELGLGSFDELAAAMCKDPALLRWLDNDVNTDKSANENFARELFELFTLGRGHYTEQDIREAARCFTGWHVRQGRFKLNVRRHDRGPKTVFGETGTFDGDDVLRLTLPRAESAEFLADKWLRWFVLPEPEPAEVDALASVYIRNERRVLPTLTTLLRSRLFFSPRAFRSKVKSPADFVIGTVRLLGGRAAPTALARTMAGLGETWLEPPSVEGWHGERSWLSEASWLLRSNFVADLFAGRRGKFAPRPSTLFTGLRRPEQIAKAAVLHLLDGRAPASDVEQLATLCAEVGKDQRADAVLHATACLPDYHLA